MRKRATATICVNCFFFLFPISLKKTGQKTALGIPVIPFPSEEYSPSDGNRQPRTVIHVKRATMFDPMG